MSAPVKFSYIIQMRFLSIGAVRSPPDITHHPPPFNRDATTTYLLFMVIRVFDFRF
jgi:hypothetical protein